MSDLIFSNFLLHSTLISTGGQKSSLILSLDIIYKIAHQRLFSKKKKCLEETYKHCVTVHSYQSSGRPFYCLMVEKNTVACPEKHKVENNISDIVFLVGSWPTVYPQGLIRLSVEEHCHLLDKGAHHLSRR